MNLQGCPPDSKSGASANFATSALTKFILLHFLKKSNIFKGDGLKKAVSPLEWSIISRVAAARAAPRAFAGAIAAECILTVVIIFVAADIETAVAAKPAAIAVAAVLPASAAVRALSSVRKSRVCKGFAPAEAASAARSLYEFAFPFAAAASAAVSFTEQYGIKQAHFYFVPL